MGPTEAIVILIIVLVLFGPTLVAFFLGYSLGKKKAVTPAASRKVETTAAGEVPAAPSAPPVPPAPGTTDTDSGTSDPGEEQHNR